MWIFSLGTWPLGTCEAVGVPAGRFRGSLASGGTWVAEIPNRGGPLLLAPTKSFRQTPGPPLAIYARINPPTLSPRVDGPLREGGEDSCGRRSYAVCASGGSYVVLPTPAPVIPKPTPIFLVRATQTPFWATVRKRSEYFHCVFVSPTCAGARKRPKPSESQSAATSVTLSP